MYETLIFFVLNLKNVHSPFNSITLNLLHVKRVE